MLKEHGSLGSAAWLQIQTLIFDKRVPLPDSPSSLKQTCEQDVGLLGGLTGFICIKHLGLGLTHKYHRGSLSFVSLFLTCNFAFYIPLNMSLHIYQDKKISILFKNGYSFKTVFFNSGGKTLMFDFYSICVSLYHSLQKRLCSVCPLHVCSDK